MKKKRRIRIWPIVLSLIVTFLVALGLAVNLAPRAYEWSRLRMVRSADVEQRLEGLTFVVRHIDEPRVRRACMEILRTADERPRHHLITVLRRQGVWDLRFGEAWVDYLADRVADEATGAESRALVAVDLGEAAWSRDPLVSSAKYRTLIGRLMRDDDAVVRYNALKALAATGKATVTDFVRMPSDPEPAVEKLKWILAGVVAGEARSTPSPFQAEGWGEGKASRGGEDQDSSPSPSLSPTWGRGEEAMAPVDATAMPVIAGQAYLWADARFIAPRDGGAYAVLNDAAAPAELRNFAPYALGLSHQASTQQALCAVVREGEANLLRRWRAVGALRPEVPGTSDAVIHALCEFYTKAPNTDAMDPLAAAAAAKLMPLYESHGRVRAAIGPVRWTGQAGRPWRELSVYASLPSASTQVAVDGDMPDLVRVHAVRAQAEPQLDDLYLALGSDQPGVRWLAARTVAGRFDGATCAEAVDRLLREFRDEYRMSGAMLGAMCGGEQVITRLQKRLTREKEWVVRQHLLLALMMRGYEPDFAIQAEGLLSRSAMPIAPVLWSMMRSGNREALDVMLAPFGGEGGGLRKLLGEELFVHVLRQCVPEAPCFDEWADARVQQFQVDVLRAWYLVHRPDLRFETATRTWRIE